MHPIVSFEDWAFLRLIFDYSAAFAAAAAQKTAILLYLMRRRRRSKTCFFAL